MIRHSHKFTIADHDAVSVLVEKLVSGRKTRGNHERLLRALHDAARHYRDSDQRVRQGFFHGLLTGYGVALKMQ